MPAQVIIMSITNSMLILYVFLWAKVEMCFYFFIFTVFSYNKALNGVTLAMISPPPAPDENSSFFLTSKKLVTTPEQFFSGLASKSKGTGAGTGSKLALEVARWKRG